MLIDTSNEMKINLENFCTAGYRKRFNLGDIIPCLRYIKNVLIKKKFKTILSISLHHRMQKSLCR